jgi:hypothetical protein
MLPKKRRRSELSASKKNGSLMPSAGDLPHHKTASDLRRWQRVSPYRPNWRRKTS